MCVCVILTWVFVGKSTCNGEDWVEALEHHRVQYHLAIAWLDRKISEVMSQLRQILKGVQRIDLLS